MEMTQAILKGKIMIGIWSFLTCEQPSKNLIARKFDQIC
jgi:hypothetical protein